MKILAFDPCSTKNLGWAVLNNEDLVIYGTEEMTDEAPFIQLHQAVQALLLTHNPAIAVMERSIGAGFAPVREKISENTGAIKLSLSLSGVPFESLNTKHCFNVVIGKLNKGEDKKKKTIEYIKNKYKLKYINEHEADAVLMALAFLEEL